MKTRVALKWHGAPLRLYVNDIPIAWKSVPFMLRNLGGDVEIDGWFFNQTYAVVYLVEHKRWLQQYLPPCGLKGKTVLDVGAGCGETAKFFLDHGASQVVCIEPDNEPYQYLLRNSELHEGVVPVKKLFEESDLYSIPHDFLKMDIEGYEMLFLPSLLKYDKPCSVETHNKYVTDRFLEAGFKPSLPLKRNYQAQGDTPVLTRW
jgi:hypothetical protein